MNENFKKILKDDLYLNNFLTLENFFKKNPIGQKTFRYYTKRSFEVLKNHVYTCVYCLDNNYIGYGHLDLENNKIWLGIMVADNFRGRGYGKYIIEDLLNQTKKEVYLSVDKNNILAINLYEKNGFIYFEDNDDYYLMINKK